MSNMFDIPVAEQIRIAREIFPDLEEIGNGICQATCPGIDCHSTANARRDFRIWFEQGKGPHEKCMHGSCEAARNAAMSQLYTLLRKADPARAALVKRYKDDRAAYERQGPTLRRAPLQPFTASIAQRIADLCPQAITEEWLRAHSPISIPKSPHAWPKLLLDSIFAPGDRILVFTKFTSQGQLMHTAGGETLRIEDRPPAYGHAYPARRRSGFPEGADNGVWFLAAPVTGEWVPNGNNRGKLGRRHAACVTRFPYLVLESDECPPAVWLRILVQLADPIVAVYTSGGKSYHALIRVNAATKEEFDLHRANYCTRLTALGADPAAITAVRLTRLPGCLRWGTGQGDDFRPYLDAEGNKKPRMQELLYLNPNADGRSILDLASNR